MPRGIPLSGDRAVWDALNYAALHTNDKDVAGGMHHTLGTGANQAAAGDHTHNAEDMTSGAALDGYVLTADGAGGAAWEASSGGSGGGVSSPTLKIYMNTNFG